jgi:short-subunit dehydrogenase
VLSIYALSNLPSHGSFSASKSAALSFTQCLRAQLRAAGIRVEALDSGVEDCYPDDVAQEFLRHRRQGPLHT